MKYCYEQKRPTRRIPLIACIAAIGATLTFTLPDAAHAQEVTPPPVPTGLEVAAPNSAFLVGHAIGTQNYATFVQRLNTVGGAMPATGCDQPTDIGKKAFVPYTADYFFFKP
jgi:hypothetical protein